MLASFPASMLNQKPSDLGIPNRFKLDPSRSSASKEQSPGSGLWPCSSLKIRLFALVDLDVIAVRRAGIELARTADLLLRIFDHLAPLADPADGAGDRKQHGEHRGGEAHRLQGDARIEIYIRIELPLDEVVVVQRDLFQLQRHFQHRIIAMAGLRQHGVT